MAYWRVGLRGCLCGVLEVFRDDWGRSWRFDFEWGCNDVVWIGGCTAPLVCII